MFTAREKLPPNFKMSNLVLKERCNHDYILDLTCLLFHSTNVFVFLPARSLAPGIKMGKTNGFCVPRVHISGREIGK